MTPNMKKVLFFLMIAMIGVIAVLHTVTPGHMLLYHDTYRRLSYFPIVIGAILYGVRGGLFMAVVSCLGFVPHLYTFWAEGPQAYYSELSEIAFYLSAGLVIGLISSSESRLKKKYQDLSIKLGKSYEKLSTQASQLIEAEKLLGESRKLSMLGEVSASFAHEIKNPLASIKGAAEILADEVGADHPKHEFVEIMRNEITRLNTSVEKVLDYCRGARKTGSKKTLKPVKDIISHVLSLLDPAIKEKQIQVTAEYGENAEKTRIPEPAMIQVFLNILINAMDAVEAKGTILIEVALQGHELCIRVSDDGPGIADDMKDKVFHSFVTTKEDGTGLGLSISKRIVESLQGKIEIETSHLGGAAFVAAIPIDR